MNRKRTDLTLLLVAFLTLIGAPTIRAQQDDGVDLQVDKNRFGGTSIQLAWTGGAPEFVVHRSVSAETVRDSASLVYTTLDRTWNDTTPGGLVYYLVRGRATCWNATADAFVEEEVPTGNRGGDDFLEIRSDVPRRYTYVQFSMNDALPKGAEILSAKLIMQQVGGNGGTSVQVRKVIDRWSESGVTWNTQPNASTGYGIVYDPSSSGRREWNLTELVQNWSDGTAASLGIRLAGVDEADYAIYAAREDVAPQLCVEWKTALESSANLLRADSLIPPRISTKRGIATFIEAEVPVTALVFNAVEAAQWYIDRYKGLYGLTDAAAETFLDRYVTDPGSGRTTVFFGTRQENIGYRAEQISVEAGISGGFPIASTIYSASAGALPEREKDREPANVALTPLEARLSAEESIPHAAIERLGEPTLVWFDPNLDADQGLPVRPAWIVTFAAQETAMSGWNNWVLHVDAETSSILHQTRPDRTVGDRPGEKFRIRTANNTNRKACWTTGTVDDLWFVEAGALGDYPGLPADVFSDGSLGFQFTHDIYHLYYDAFGRQSWNGKGKKIKMFVHVSDPDDDGVWDNAAYVSGCNHIVFGDGQVTNDVVGHEFTHAVDRWTANLKYENQSGALDESFADYFGSILDGDWQLGEDELGGVGPSSGGGPIRDLSDPPLWGDPDHIDPAVSGDLTGLRPVGSGDKGGVHTNSGIPNKVAYLVTDGGVHNGFQVFGSGTVKAPRLWYHTLVFSLHKNSDFDHARNSLIRNARNFEDHNRYGFDIVDVCDVINAWASVGIGDPDANCDGEPDSGGDYDGDGIPDSRDNCSGEPNAGQADLDGDGAGDACDPDDDGDTVLDVNDICKRDPNTGQQDTDGDGVGDACDDLDLDGVPIHLDNCPNVANANQRDFENDGLGDVCDPDDDDDGVLDGADNCPFFANPGQSDVDSDGVGDTCDNCLSTFNPGQENVDNDSQGDECDLDDDNDGLLDINDNCAQYYNPDQVDNDGNMIGMWCDVGELALLQGFAEMVQLSIFVQHTDLTKPLRFPIFPCGAGTTCPNVLPEAFEVQVDVTMSPAYFVRVVDDLGREMDGADFDATGNYSLTFDADHEYYYDAGGATQAYEGRKYFLEMVAPDGATPGAVTGTIDVMASDQTPP